MLSDHPRVGFSNNFKRITQRFFHIFSLAVDINVHLSVAFIRLCTYIPNVVKQAPCHLIAERVRRINSQPLRFRLLINPMPEKASGTTLTGTLRNQSVFQNTALRIRSLRHTIRLARHHIITTTLSECSYLISRNHKTALIMKIFTLSILSTNPPDTAIAIPKKVVQTVRHDLTKTIRAEPISMRLTTRLYLML